MTEVSMQYLLMLYVNESGWPKLSKAEQEQGLAAYTAYTEALTKAGAPKGANRLQPSSTATSVRTTSGKTQVLDGPYADSKEQLGGYYLMLLSGKRLTMPEPKFPDSSWITLVLFRTRAPTFPPAPRCSPGRASEEALASLGHNRQSDKTDHIYREAAIL
jgi:hypothetical protein